MSWHLNWGDGSRILANWTSLNRHLSRQYLKTLQASDPKNVTRYFTAMRCWCCFVPRQICQTFLAIRILFRNCFYPWRELSYLRVPALISQDQLLMDHITFCFHGWVDIFVRFITPSKSTTSPSRSRSSPRTDPTPIEIVNNTRACSKVLVAVSERWNPLRRWREVFGKFGDAVLYSMIRSSSSPLPQHLYATPKHSHSLRGNNWIRINQLQSSLLLLQGLTASNSQEPLGDNITRGRMLPSQHLLQLSTMECLPWLSTRSSAVVLGIYRTYTAWHIPVIQL
jgi:hypothetical protein